MGPPRKLVLLLFMSAEISIGSTEAPPTAAVVVVSPQSPFYSGERVTLRCEVAKYTDWSQYYWYRDNSPVPGGNSETITITLPQEAGQYQCSGQRKDRPQTSSLSEHSHIECKEKPKPAVRGPPQTWLTEGDSVTLSCEVTGSTTDWRFHWYKTAPYRPELLHVTHESRGYYVEMLSDSIRGVGGSYTLSPAALRHTGVYVCRAERGEPAYHTEFSQPQPLWITGHSPPSSLVVHPNRNHHFDREFLSLSCVGSVNLTGWRLRWFTRWSGNKMCPTGWTEAGSTCRTEKAIALDGGVYWCQSESGEQSNPVNITVHTGNVILESPVHPVTEGDHLTLRCSYRYQPSNISADFYKDGTLLQTSTTGEMTIPAVSKSHEGLYKCSNPERGESPVSWITVKVLIVPAPYSGSSLLVPIGGVVGLVIMVVLIIILFLLYRFKKLKAGLGIQTTPPGQQRECTNHRSNQDQSQPGESDGAQSEYMPLQRGTTDVYDTIKADYMPLQPRNTNIYETLKIAH
ncbi:B-cell receptor CD22-like [Alosa sapidissima]|uniref:B-cell receptor CD22-like n=1 Tax=Alosa sapidissima TaxID=34773 RepID=UPI001C09D9CE|nr:B-cell receptor CD22-like isoform X2 [Alosa sapidissima]XP_041925192.1 B-cell receptor CD22-like [Alosa sapidissima]